MKHSTTLRYACRAPALVLAMVTLVTPTLFALPSAGSAAEDEARLTASRYGGPIPDRVPDPIELR